MVLAPAAAGSGRAAQISPRSDCFEKKFGFCSGDTAHLDKAPNVLAFYKLARTEFKKRF